MSSKETICCEVNKRKVSANPMAPSICLTSSFYFDDYDSYISASQDELSNYVYTRSTNPTNDLLQDMLAKLQGGQRCKVFSSGMGAISASLLSHLSAGDHVLVINICYGTTVGFVECLNKFGIESTYIKSTDTSEIAKGIKENTKVIYMESPSSQKFELLDLEAISKLAKANNSITMIDNTWATPMFQNPFEFGIDIVIHSLSKYVGGHSDIVGGAVICSDELMRPIEEFGLNYIGATPSPVNCALAIRGIRTLAVRTKAQDASVRYLIDNLKNDKRIKKIWHPYAFEGEQKERGDKYLTGYASLLAIDLKDENLDKMKEFVESLSKFTFGVSWGGFESLVLPVYKGTNVEAIAERGLQLTHVRLYIGLEDSQELVDCVKDSLDKVYGEVNE